MYTITFIRSILRTLFAGLLISVSGAKINQKRTPTTHPKYTPLCRPAGGQPSLEGSKIENFNANIAKINNQTLSLEIPPKSCEDILCTVDSNIQLCNEKEDMKTVDKAVLLDMLDSIRAYCVDPRFYGQVSDGNGINVVHSTNCNLTPASPRSIALEFEDR
ncbi:hypothetical protein GLAREA_07576 [Glarea lozoyensis ATCC 20868]|uniref:Secreted protein n=1 Tax=Glarea lozoyensis (strain ATCC 20868 / MF5171) TaxID=1116229 RepID=S3E1T5_GLAL2|nr:uncharacterized protein GLAREA_07576 [Glarea lozoyensis ATCC 20868]EPE32443.1 hypothetical protein GLAREA_07576 [Glarea lozoyensis ATCC 20868]